MIFTQQLQREGILSAEEDKQLVEQYRMRDNGDHVAKALVKEPNKACLWIGRLI